MRGEAVTVTAELPSTAPFAGVEFVFGFAGGKITRVEQVLSFPAVCEAPRIRSE